MLPNLPHQGFHLGQGAGQKTEVSHLASRHRFSAVGLFEERNIA
jgi:hypothetical protein